MITDGPVDEPTRNTPHREPKSRPGTRPEQFRIAGSPRRQRQDAKPGSPTVRKAAGPLPKGDSLSVIDAITARLVAELPH